MPRLGIDSRVVIAGQYEHDDVRGSVGTGSVTVRVPLSGLFGIGPPARARLTGLDRRMVAPVVRDVDIVTNAISAAEGVLFADSGIAVSGATVIDASTPDVQSLIDGTGTSGVIFVDGSAGPITADRVTVKSSQRLLGGATPLSVVGVETGSAFVFDPGLQRPTFAVRVEAREAVDVRFEGFNSTATVAARGGDLLIRDVAIDIAEADTLGLLLTTNSSVRLVDSSIRTTGVNADAVFGLSPNLGLEISNSSISTSGTEANGIFWRGNRPLIITNSTISTSGHAADVLFLQGSLSDVVISDSTLASSGSDSELIFAQGSSGTAVISRSVLSTAGTAADGLFFLGGSNTYQLFDTKISTTGTSAGGIRLSGGNVVSATGGSIQVTGTSSRAITGFGGTFTSVGTTIIEP
ncbi:MAG: hypothetical protein AAF532_07155 [Planctomycetota bacterium]